MSRNDIESGETAWSIATLPLDPQVSFSERSFHGHIQSSEPLSHEDAEEISLKICLYGQLVGKLASNFQEQLAQRRPANLKRMRPARTHHLLLVQPPALRLR